MDAKNRIPVLPGWFTLEHPAHLLGTRCQACGTYYFPKQAGFCRNPDCGGERFEEVELSRSGRLWSYTDACYKPPEPYLAAEPYVPFGIAAVELETERMIVLGQLAQGVALESLRVGMPMELVVETLSETGDTQTLVWKWKPAEESAAEGRRPASLSRAAGEGRAAGGAGGGVREETDAKRRSPGSLR